MTRFLEPLATINLPKSPTVLRQFLERCQKLSFSSEIILAGTFIDIWRFFSGHTGCVLKVTNTNNNAGKAF